MKHFFAALCALVISGSAAAAGYDMVVVHLNDGSKVDIALGENLKMKFTDNDLVVTGADADVTVPRSNIQYFMHESANAVSDVTADQTVRYTGDALEISGLAEGTALSVVDAAGQVVRSLTVNGDCQVSLGELPSGVYVVSYGKNSFKIFIK